MAMARWKIAVSQKDWIELVQKNRCLLKLFKAEFLIDRASNLMAVGCSSMPSKQRITDQSSTERRSKE